MLLQICILGSMEIVRWVVVWHKRGGVLGLHDGGGGVSFFNYNLGMSSTSLILFYERLEEMQIIIIMGS